MAKKIIYTPYAPEPLGPYSQAVQQGKMLFVSGQIPIVPEKGKIVAENVADQTIQVMKNIEAILEAAQFSFSDIVKCSIFIKNMNDFSIINDIYAQYFDSDNAPARETVEVSKLPKDALIEISCIGIKD